jgi:cysteine desulfurase family protein (TIGR01976 family)
MDDPLDVEALRRRFPALAREVAGRPAAFLDGPGGSQAPDAVIEAIAGHLTRGTANDGGVFATSLDTIGLVAAAREAAADLTGSGSDEIAFGANMTTLSFLLAHAVARTLAPGDEIVVTELDHDANVAPWLRVAEDHGLVVHRAGVRREDATLDPAEVAGLIGERTRVVAVTLASNAVGSITDLAPIAAAARAAGALVWCDAVHLAPHARPDRTALGADVLLFSPYKVFGPHLGVAAIRRDLAEGLPADRVRPAAQTPAGHRFETGTPSFEALAGFVAAVGYLEALGEGADRVARLEDAYARIAAHETGLCHGPRGLAALDP